MFKENLRTQSYLHFSNHNCLYIIQKLLNVFWVFFSVLQVGKSVVINSCKKCTCSSEKDPVTHANIMHCETVQCETSCPLVSSGSLGCPVSHSKTRVLHCQFNVFSSSYFSEQGYQYMTEEGECCGKCIEVACKVKLSNSTVHVLSVSIPLIFRSLCQPTEVRTTHVPYQ